MHIFKSPSCKLNFQINRLIYLIIVRDIRQTGNRLAIVVKSKSSQECIDIEDHG